VIAIIAVSQHVAALENLNDGRDINRAWKTLKRIKKYPAKESLGLNE
jgi:hypothetical protein